MHLQEAFSFSQLARQRHSIGQSAIYRHGPRQRPITSAPIKMTGKIPKQISCKTSKASV
jgi:hypothetical protein